MIKNYKKVLKILLITLIILFFILLLILLLQQNTTPTSSGDIQDNKDVFSLMECKYIKEEMSSSPDYYLDIYLEFGKLLYDGTESNEEYYARLTQLVAKVNGYVDFRLIDEKNNIVVAIICNENEIERTIINGDSNYYGKVESTKQLAEFTRPVTTELEIQSGLLKQLLNNDWKISILDLEEGYDIENNYELYPETGLKIKTINSKVFNMIFMDAYKAAIVNNLKVENSLEEVVQTLGEPTFGTVEEQTIGYKSNELYVFFTEDEISVYRVEDYNSEEFEKEVIAYQEDSNIKTYISNITDIWPDYDNYYYDANTVDLSYILKGVKIQYGITGNHGITFYTNYTGKVNNKQIEEITVEEIPKEVYFNNSDLVAEYELQRAEQHRMFLYPADEEQEEYFGETM